MSSFIPNPESTESHVVCEDEAGSRLDVFLASRIEDASRSFLKGVIQDRCVRVNGQIAARPSRQVSMNDTVEIQLPAPPNTDLQGEDIPLDVLYEDEHMLIVNKPSGLVVHPAPGHHTGTLVNAVLFHCSDFQSPGNASDGVVRPGIVHRLDRFTSGVMVVAKSQRGFNSLSQQSRDHSFDRRYCALVRGEFSEDAGVIRASIGRSLADRKRMAVTGVNARDAVTHFRVRERFGIASLVELKLETGRTHQIRVHMRFAGKPILGDSMYGVTDYSSWEISASALAALVELQGQALHAELLGVSHPVTGERMRFVAPPPPDFQAVLGAFRDLQP